MTEKRFGFSKLGSAPGSTTEHLVTWGRSLHLSKLQLPSRYDEDKKTSKPCLQLGP